jgi:hypothetical protein
VKAAGMPPDVTFRLQFRLASAIASRVAALDSICKRSDDHLETYRQSLREAIVLLRHHREGRWRKVRLTMDKLVLGRIKTVNTNINFLHLHLPAQKRQRKPSSLWPIIGNYCNMYRL